MSARGVQGCSLAARAGNTECHRSGDIGDNPLHECTPCGGHVLTIAGGAVNARYMEDDTAVTQPVITEMSFEQALSALEQVVRQLESGDVPLDESINLYSRGEELRKACQARLDAAQARIEAIVQDGSGNASGTRPFDSTTQG